MRLGKYEVWITSKGKRLSEYNTEGYENEIICNIESQVGQVGIPMFIHSTLVVCITRADNDCLGRH